MAEKTCFVIAPIGEVDSETRKRSDQILKYIIKPAVEECGYTVQRADQIREPGMITHQIIEHIINDSLVIADLSERNSNVFYELALRHTIGKPLIHIMAMGEQLPFDVVGMRTIFIDYRDLKSAEKSKSDIIGQINALEDGSYTASPISIAIDLKSLRQSNDLKQKILADILSTVNDLGSALEGMEQRILKAVIQIMTSFYSLELELERRKPLSGLAALMKPTMANIQPSKSILAQLAGLLDKENEK